MMEIVVSFETDFWVCGLAPFRSHLVALAYIDDDEEPADGTAPRYASVVFLILPLTWRCSP
jgi:hypothetical protein